MEGSNDGNYLACFGVLKKCTDDTSWLSNVVCLSPRTTLPLGRDSICRSAEGGLLVGLHQIHALWPIDGVAVHIGDGGGVTIFMAQAAP